MSGRRTRPDPQHLLATALSLAAEGLPVLACVPDAKRPLTRHGMLDATTDAGTIRAWWRHRPDANVAAVTGIAAFDVLDVDVRTTGSGYPAFDRLLRARLLEGCTRIVATPSGGLHAYFTGTDQASTRLPGHHLDLKATGGYVLVPPSVVDGRPYEAIHRRGYPPAPLNWRAVRRLLVPDQVERGGRHGRSRRSDAPSGTPRTGESRTGESRTGESRAIESPAIESRTAGTPHAGAPSLGAGVGASRVGAADAGSLAAGSMGAGSAAGDGRGMETLAAWVARLPEGQRNTGTFWAACRAAEEGYTDLRPIVDAAVAAGLPRWEAARTVGSAIRTVTTIDDD